MIPLMCVSSGTDMRESKETVKVMPSKQNEIELNIDELREIVGFAVECAQRVLPLFKRYMPDDTRPREAIEAALAFSKSGKRSNALRASGLAAFRAAHAVDAPAAKEAAQAATQTIGAAFLHPLAKAHQVRHILGSAAYAARAAELDAGDDPNVGAEYCDWAIKHMPATVATVLARYPPAPAGGGRVGELIRELDSALRQ
jgi:hypothetical protein